MSCGWACAAYVMRALVGVSRQAAVVGSGAELECIYNSHCQEALTPSCKLAGMNWLYAPLIAG